MKILLFMEYLPEGDDAQIMGGIEARCFYVARWLRQDHDVLLYIDRTGGARSTHASARSLPRRLWYLLRSVARGLRADFDVIDSTSSITHPFAWLLGLLRHKPVVLWYPDVLIGSWRGGHFGKIGALGELVERLTLKLPGLRYMAISDSTRSKLLDQGVAPERIEVVPCGYEPSVVDEILPEHGVPRRPGQIVLVNRLVPYKRVDLLIDAVAKLAPERPDLRATIIGSGPQFGVLREHAERQGVDDRVEFAGLVESHLDVLRAVAEAEVFVSCSEIEGFGIVVVEAMSLATPYVVTDIPAFREVTGGGIGGTLFPRGDAGALANAVAELLDAPDRRAVGDRGRAFAARYTWQSVAEQTAAYYAKVIQEHERHRARS